MCVGRVRVNLKNFPLVRNLYSHWRVPTFTENGSKENRTRETNDSAMKQKAKNINIDYIVFLNTTDDDDFFNTTRFFLSFFLSFFLAAVCVARIRFY